jgi:uncharacterized membrane protein
MDSQNNTNQGGQSNNTQTPPNTPDHVKSGKTLFGILSYLGPLVILSFLVKKDDAFVKFHIKQGLVLLAIQIILWLLSSMLMMWSLWPVYKIVHLAIVVLAIIGIVNVIQNKEKELPLVGGLAKHFPI